MKKVYLLVASLVINANIFAQFKNQSQFSDPFPHLEKAIETQNSQLPYFLNKSNKNAKTQGGPFKLAVNPIRDIIINKGLTVGDQNPMPANPNQTPYLFSVFQDSTVSLIASNGAKVNNNQILFGATLDPKSIFLQSSFLPIVTKADPYMVDTIIFRASYVKKTPDIDTLYLWLQWGDSTNTSAYDKRATSIDYVSPISTWRSSVLNPKISGASSAHGNKLRAASSNSFLVKYVLQPTDSVNNPATPAVPQAPYGYSKFIAVPLTSTLNPNGITIPAGNIVSCFYTFVPGGTTYTLGIPFYSFTSTVVPTVNGFAGMYYFQQNPLLNNNVNNLVDHQVDKNSWNAGIIAGRFTRYAMYGGASSYRNQMAWDAALFYAPVIWFSITGNSTVSLNELDSKGFLLGQNVPNPSQGKSKVSYYLSKNAKSAIFRITDVTGRLISSENVDATIGQHEVNIPSYAPGLYYYSLNVDGNISTNKLIAQ